MTAGWPVLRSSATSLALPHGGCTFGFTRRVHADDAVSWEFLHEETFQHSDACGNIPPIERSRSITQRDRLLLKLSLGIAFKRILQDETNEILRLTENGSKMLHSALMPRPIIFESELKQLATQFKVPGYAQRDPDDMTSARVALEEGVTSKFIAAAVLN